MRAIISFHDISTAPGPLSYPAASFARLIERRPRLDSHHLRHPWIMRRLAAPGTGAYLALRGLIRRVRGIS